MVEETSPRVGFIGLGLMGSGIAANLLTGGADLTVFDISTEAVENLRRQGAKVASSIAELARQSDVIFTSLPGPAQFEDVLLRADGIAENMRPGLVIFDLTTNALEPIQKAHAVISELGGTLLDAPVSGGPAGARTRDLVVWAGGDKAAFDACRPLLDMISMMPMHVGPIGAGVVTKLAHNMLGNTIMRALSESFSLAVKAGLDPLDYWNALRHGSAGKQAPVFLLHKQFLPNTYEPAAFALELAYKDMNLALALAEKLGVPTSLAKATHEDMRAAISEGHARKDAKVFLKQQLARAGVTIEVPGERVEAAVAAAKG